MIAPWPKRYNVGEKNGRAKLTEEKVIDVLARLEDGQKHITIARRHGVTQAAISLIAVGKTWSHVREREGSGR